MITLEQQVDKPIRRVVALLNLWEIETRWSCCGYDYKNPESTKDHIHGTPQIWTVATYDAFNKLLLLLDSEVFAVNKSWNFIGQRRPYQAPMLMLFCNFRTESTAEDCWDNKDSIHYHEKINVCIQHLEDRLLEFKDQFQKEVILKDHNARMKEAMPDWQINPVADWVIKYEDYVKTKTQQTVKINTH